MIGPALVELFRTLPPLVELGVAAFGLYLLACAGWYAIISAVVVLGYGRSKGWPDDLTLIASVAALVGVYIFQCLRDPRKPCFWCKGAGRFINAGGFFHNCGLCNGRGQRRRLGAKVLARHRDQR